MSTIINKNKLLSFLIIVPILLGCSPKTYSVSDYRQVMTFHDDFKILQITDLHYGVESDLKTQLDFLKQSIDETNPDLIILTGDNFMYASKDVVKNTIGFINDCCKQLSNSNNDKLTKFALTFGNHDNQGDYPRYFINKVMNSYVTTHGNEKNVHKYASFVDYEDDNLFGLTNYYIDLVDKNNNDDVKYRLHIIDSNTYKFLGFKYGYDVIHTDQLEHVKNIYNTATSDKDYIGLAFFHIPLLNYKEAIEQYYSSSNPSEKGRGSFLDKEHYPYEDNNAYQYLKDGNIVGYFTGHDHKNYGEILYEDNQGDLALFSYGVKSSNQLYHNDDQIGYKLITLKDGITKNDFLSMEYINNNIVNVLDRGDEYGE